MCLTQSLTMKSMIRKLLLLSARGRPSHRHHSVGIVGAPFYQGQPLQGVELGPDLIRDAGLLEGLRDLGCTVKDYGNLKFEDLESEPIGTLKRVQAVGAANQTLAAAVQAVKNDGHTSVMLGGDHSLAIGSIQGHAAAVRDLSVVWVDAHADINTPLTTPTGNFHGQPMSFLLHELRSKIPVLPSFSWVQPCLSARDLIYIGLRDVDPEEHFILKYLGVKIFSMSDVDRLGVSRVMEETCDYVSVRVKKPIHLSYDIDAIDPSITPATGTPVVGGLSYREGVYISEQLCQTGLLSGVDMVEVNPRRGRSDPEIQSTVTTAKHLLLACLGRRREGSHSPDYVLPLPSEGDK